MRLWAAADLRAELVELFALLHERTDHLVAPLEWPGIGADEPPPPVPLGLHGRYSRAEVFAAFGHLNEARRFPGREGVFFHESTQCDVLFITLKKSERLFSPTTRYNDYAISPWEFHWESQSNTRETSSTGQRYIHHEARSSRVLLCRFSSRRLRLRGSLRLRAGTAPAGDGHRADCVPWVCALRKPQGRAVDGGSLAAGERSRRLGCR